jgi:hypothetical protein
MSKLSHLIPWFYVTRALGVVFVMYGLLVDDTADRGTIILSGLGLLGVDKVARSEPKDKTDSSKGKE